MASNTIAGVNLARIAQRTLNTLTPELVPLKEVFAADFSAEVATGPTITTRYATKPTVKALRTAANRVSSNSAMTAVTVTIGDPRGIDIGFDDVEIINSDVDLERLFIRPGIVAVVEDIFASIFAIILEANYSQETSAIAAADFTTDAVADLATSMSTAQIPAAPRSMILKPTYYGAIVKDRVTTDTDNTGTLTTRNAGRVHGIQPYEFSGTIPSNDQGLEGFACHPDAICIGARMPATPQDWYGRVENVVEPITGMPIQFRHFYDGAEHRLQMLTQFGAAKGNPGNLIRIVSA